MFVNLAKDPTDVIWENVGREKRLKFCISGLVILLDFVLLVGFGVFTSAISASTNLDAIRQGWPALDQVLTEKPWLVVVFDQVAPLLLVIIFALVPPIQGLIIELHKPSSLSTTVSKCSTKYALSLTLFECNRIYGSTPTITCSSWSRSFCFIRYPDRSIRFCSKFIPIRGKASIGHYRFVYLLTYVYLALRILAAVVPGNAVFYMQYILLQAFVVSTSL